MRFLLNDGILHSVLFMIKSTADNHGQNVEASGIRARSKSWHGGCELKSTNILRTDSCSYRNGLIILGACFVLIACLVPTYSVTRVSR